MKEFKGVPKSKEWWRMYVNISLSDEAGFMGYSDDQIASMTDTAMGICPDSDPFDGTNIPRFLRDEEAMLPREIFHTEEDVQKMKDGPLEGWIKYGPKLKKP